MADRAEREPCPDRILDDVGGAFGMGVVGGSIFHFMKGTYNSPKGMRFVGGAQNMRMYAPRTSGAFAVWGGLFSTFDCTMAFIRQREDPWNSIMAGASTGAFLAMRQCLRAASKHAVVGGVLLAVIEGAGIAVNRMLSQVPQDLPVLMDGYPNPAATDAGKTAGGTGSSKTETVLERFDTPNTSSSLFGRWFGGEKIEEKKSTSSNTEIVLESSDRPSAPIPSFEYN